VTFNPGGIGNAASYLAGPVAPGEIVAIAINRLTIPTGAATAVNTTVTFDSFKAPLVNVTSTQITAMVPFEISGQTTTVLKIGVAGQNALPVTLGVSPTMPGIFITGVGPTNGADDPAAVLNQDGTVNGQSNPAARGSTVSIYGTGGGVLLATATDGAITGSSSPPPTVARFTATIDGQNAPVSYAGAAPALINGVVQVNATVPQSANTGLVRVAIAAGGAASQRGAVMWVK
jgi:uncharacterized protein (TIGR03437 family)